MPVRMRTYAVRIFAVLMHIIQFDNNHIYTLQVGIVKPILEIMNISFRQLFLCFSVEYLGNQAYLYMVTYSGSNNYLIPC